ncbi:hypothetical protein D3C76_1713520 [compost metagenome]
MITFPLLVMVSTLSLSTEPLTGTNALNTSLAGAAEVMLMTGGITEAEEGTTLTTADGMLSPLALLAVTTK